MYEHLPTLDQERALRILLELTRRSHKGPPVWGNLRREWVRTGFPDPEGLAEGLPREWLHNDGPLGLSTPVRLTFDGLRVVEPDSIVLILFVEVVSACHAAYLRHEPASLAIYEPVTVPGRDLLRPGLDAETLAILHVLLEGEGICRPVPTANGARRMYEVSERIARLAGVTDPDAYRRARFRGR